MRYMKIIKKLLKSTLIFSLSLGLVLSNWPHQIKIAYAVNQKIRQEINIINGYVGSASGAYATSSERVQIDTTAYTSPTYYFEVVASTTSAVSSSIYLKNATTSATVATVTFSNSNTYGIYRSASFTPTSGQHDYVVVTGNSAVQKGVIAARVVVLQDATALAATETQIEIGNRETGKTNTSSSALTYPKYWYYDSTKWSDSPTFSAEVTYGNTQVSSSTTYTTSGTFTYVPIRGVSYTVVELWGAGGAGGVVANSGGGGGGGGAYARSTTTTSGSKTLVVAATTAADSTTSNDSTWGTTEVVADGGAGTGTATAGTGGTTANSVGQVEFAGGNGGAGNGTGDSGGGGGSAAGPYAAGNTGTAASTSAGGAGASCDASNGGAVGGTADTNDATAPDGGNGNSNVNCGSGGGGGDNGDFGGSGGAPGGGGGGGEITGGQVGGRGQARITDIHGQVGIALEEDNGSFGSWTFKKMIVTNGVATSSPSRVRVSFTPTTGRNYRIVASTTASTASYDIYNAKIVASQESSIFQVGNGDNTIFPGANSTMTALSSNRIVFIDDAVNNLQVKDFNGTNWTNVGNFGLGGPYTRISISALSSTRIAYIDYTNKALRAYDYTEGTDTWAQVGSDLTITGLGYPVITALSSTRIALFDESNDSLRAYDFNGSTWSLVGSGLTITGAGTAALGKLSSSRVAFIDFNNDSLRAYDFDGSNWAQVGSSLAISNVGHPAMTALSSSRIAFYADDIEEIRSYDFDGSTWTQSGTSLSVGAGGGIHEASIATLASNEIAFIDNGTVDELRTYDINVVASTGITYLEPQYLLANTLFSSGTSLQNFLTSWDPAEWTTGNAYVFIHEGNSVSGGTSDIKIQNTSGPTDISGSTITDVIEREQSSAMTMPGSAATLDVVATSNGSNLYGSRILVQVSPSASVPDAPTSLDAVAGYGRVNLTWVTPASNGGSSITGYKLYRDTTTSPTTLIATLGVVTSYWDGAITNGTLYYYRVKATNAIGDSAYSNEDSATPTAAPASSSRSGIKFIGPSLKFLGGRILFR